VIGRGRATAFGLVIGRRWGTAFGLAVSRGWEPEPATDPGCYSPTGSAIRTTLTRPGRTSRWTIRILLIPVCTP
jgi:hypothetical protein